MTKTIPEKSAGMIADIVDQKVDKKSPAKARKPARKKASESQSLTEEAAEIATTAIVSEIILRSVGSIVRRSFEAGILSHRYDKNTAKRIVKNRSLLHTATAFGVTRIATRSLPGALLVGGGLLAKTLFDRGQARKAARKKPAKKPADQA